MEVTRVVYRSRLSTMSTRMSELMRWSPTLLVLAVACSPELVVPDEVIVTCTADRDCPGGEICRGGYCTGDTTPDETPPQLVNVAATDLTTIVLSFNEPVRPDVAVTFTPELPVEEVVAVDNFFNLEVHVVGQRTAQLYTVHVDIAFGLQGNALDPTTSDTYFFGFGATPNRDPPDALAPLTTESVPMGEVVLVWSPRTLTFSYTVEVAETPTFTNAVTYVLPANQTSLTITVDKPITYYWRVRGDVTSAGEYGQSFVDVRDSVIYVYCEPGVVCDDTGRVGNRSKPFRTVNRGMTEAAAQGLTEVLIAGRGPGEVYDEQLALIPGINLRGGYSADFGTRGNEAVIDHSQLHTVIAYQVTTPTVIEELTFDGGATITVLARGCTDALQFRNVTFRSRRSMGEKVFLAQDCPVAAGPQIIDSLIDTGDNMLGPAAEYYGCGGRVEGSRIIGNHWPLDISHNSTTMVVGNYVTLMQGGATAAISADGSDAVIVGNRVDVGPMAFGPGIEDGALVMNNVLCAASAAMRNPRDQAIVNRDSAGIVANNTICGPVAGLGSDFYNNIIAVEAASADCFNGVLSSGYTVTNNAFVNCNGQSATNGNVIFATIDEIAFAGFPFDVHLLDTSPTAVRTGGVDAATYGVTNDFDGTPRTCDAGQCFSMGAYEW